MINQDEAYLREKWLEFWTMENHDRPLMCIYAPKAGAVPAPVPAPQRLEDRWTDMDYIIARGRENMKNTFYGGEAFPSLFADLGPDLVGAVCGCGIEFGKNTSWAVHVVEDWEKYPPIRFNPENPWWKRIYEMTRRLAEDARGDYLVGMVDLHPGTDALVSLRGPQELCMDLFDCPEQLPPRIWEIFEVYKTMFQQLSALIAPCQQGSTNWMGIWHPEANWYPVSSDFSCLVSQEQYEEFVARILSTIWTAPGRCITWTASFAWSGWTECSGYRAPGPLPLGNGWRFTKKSRPRANESKPTANRRISSLFAGN